MRYDSGQEETVSRKHRSIKRKKAKKRIRGTPAFDNPLVGTVKPVESITPETNMDVARLLVDEITKKWPDAKTRLPENLSGKHVKLTRALTEEFNGEQIRSMIRVLVWDFEEIKKSKAFYPPCPSDYPWIDQLYIYRFALASVTGTGITDATSRSSTYAQRYLSGETPQAPKPVETPAGEAPAKESLKDIARRLLGQ